MKRLSYSLRVSAACQSGVIINHSFNGESPEQLLTRWLDKYCHEVLGIGTDVQKDTRGLGSTEAEAELFFIQVKVSCCGLRICGTQQGSAN